MVIATGYSFNGSNPKKKSQAYFVMRSNDHMRAQAVFLALGDPDKLE